MKNPAVYMMANRPNGTLYTGVTSNLIKRVHEHKTGVFQDAFTKRHDCKMLVWYEMHETMESAIAREKQIKGGSRSKKLRLIQIMNPDWNDLYDELF